jgi:hypothetical protein
MDVMTHWIVVYRRRGRATKVHNVASSQRLRRIFLGSCIINHPCCAAVAKLDLPAEGNTLETRLELSFLETQQSTTAKAHDLVIAASS